MIVTIIFIQLQMITQKFVGLTVVGKGVVSAVGGNVGNPVVPAVGFNVDVGDDVGNSVSVVLIVLSVGASVSSSLEFEEYPTQSVSPPSQSASTSKGRDAICSHGR